MDAVEPNWGMLRPFVMDSASQFRAAPPHPFDTTAASPFLREAREVYDTGAGAHGGAAGDRRRSGTATRT